MPDELSTSRILTLVFTDLADSTALKTTHGDAAVGDLIGRHRECVQRLAAECGGRVIDWAGDGCFLTFETASAAVMFALQLQQAHADMPELPGVRTGLHMGEVGEQAGPDGAGGPPRVAGLAVDLAARISGLARPGQILMSEAVGNSARPRIDPESFGQPVRWQAYGNFLLKGFDEPLSIREAGLEGIASFVAPVASEKAAPVMQSSPPARRFAPLALGSLALLGALVTYLVWPSAPESSAAPGAKGVPQATDPTSEVVAFASRPAIAVLPFENRSPDAEQAFFADGLAEDLITRLSTWRAFPVIARSSSFQYRGGTLDLKRVSTELGARYLVEGSVRRSGDQIRVTAQLIDASTSRHIWADTYDRAITDFFTLQDEISSTIAASLVDDLTRAEGERARQRGTEDLEAWSLYQLGMQHAERFSLEEYREARRYFIRAVDRDPRFATAEGQLALSTVMEIMLGGGSDREDMVSTAFESARRAVALDARDPTAHAALGGAYLAAGDPKNGIDSTQRAVDLNPSMPEAWIWLGWAQVLAGNPAAAIVASQRAQRLNPQGSMVWIYENLSVAYWEVGRYEEGLELARRLVAAHPSYFTGYAYIAMNAIALGKIEEARAAITAGRNVRPDFSLALIQGYFGVSRPDFDARRNDVLRQAGLE